ncbi:hypothetical protein [Halorarius litoreus]|uniref:hypothetical protein n=1 Tax=Halorarius litoreus TaxID=2962676 RepID=UPI0020CCEE5D|nr:hypothetical protein [Halorarius litoreus]
MDPFVLHINDVPTTTGRVAIGAVAGLLATVIMNIPMQRRPEGSTPPFIAAGALTGQPLDEVDPKLASGVHYSAGILGGVLFTLLAIGFESVLPFTAALTGVGLRLVPHFLATLVTYGFLVAFFAYLVFPQFGKSANQRGEQVRTDWVISASVYVVALALWIPLLIASL